MIKHAALFLTLVVLTAPAALYGDSSLQVKTDTGTVEGAQSGAIREFLGIPYAAPPVGDLRWKAPQPPIAWNGVRKATHFAARCMQAPVYADMIFRDAGDSEDCLYLNVWTPAESADAKLPVMVWIYGGGFLAGASSEPRQDGTNLAKHGVVVVSMNYRLGIFGFFVDPEAAAESGHNSAGNYGLLDQVAALHWVQANIAAFCGDPSNVTIFGESAGSFSVSSLMASPLTKGLFEKAIGESGGAFSRTGLRYLPLADREKKDVQLMKDKLGVSSLAALRAIPAQKLMDAFYQPHGDFSFGPDVDGYFLPEPVPEIFAQGKQNDVPLLAGWNHDEGSFVVEGMPKPPDAASLKAMAEKQFGKDSPEFLKLYPSATSAEALRSTEDFAGDQFIIWGTWRWIEAQAKTGTQPVYHYRFDLGQPNPLTGKRVAFHSSEIDYVFGQLDARPGVIWAPEDRYLSRQMQEYWTNFAKTGNPNGPGLAEWPVYSAGDGWQVMYLDNPCKAQKDKLRDRHLFLDKEWGK
jgi:para-nitrobenzyl esterase